MMFVLGVFIGVLVARAWRFRRRWHRRHGWHGRRGPIFWKLRRLGLDRDQMDQVEQIWNEASEHMKDVPFGRFRAMSELLDLTSADVLDRGRLDELADRWAEAQARAARAVADAVAKLHEVLRPEQRSRLRDFVGYGSTAGPYR